MNQTQDPRHAAYEAMTEHQKAAHIKQHEAVLDSCVDLFEMFTGYRGMDVRAESAWGDIIFYTARYRSVACGFSVDRRYPVEGQIAVIEHGLKRVQGECERFEMEKELRKIIELHGVTEDRKA